MNSKSFCSRGGGGGGGTLLCIALTLHHIFVADAALHPLHGSFQIAKPVCNAQPEISHRVHKFTLLGKADTRSG